MRIASTLAGFSMGKADLLRRAMGKKKAALMAEQRALFIEGAARNDIPEALATEIFNMMDKFAGYGFVKPHSTCYALIAFQTAYLKRHYPAEFMASALSSEMGSTDRVVVLIEECKRMGLNVLSPDVNESFADFKVIDGAIRFGLGAVKNVGRSAIDSIVQTRTENGKFQNLFEFCERVDSRLVNKKVIESLIQAGAMDSLEGHRAQKMDVAEIAMGFAQTSQAEKLRGQTSLFGSGDAESVQYPPMPFIAPWGDLYQLNVEKEMLGFYISGHPLGKYEKEVKTFSTIGLQHLTRLKDRTALIACGIVLDCKTKLDRKDKMMAFVTLEDFTGMAEVLVFASVYTKFREQLQADKMVSISGRISAREDGDTKIICREVIPLEEVWEKWGKNLHLRMDVMGVDDPLLSKVNSILRQNPGKCNLFIDLKTAEDKRQLIRARKLKVKPTYDVITELRDLLGSENVWMEGDSTVSYDVPERRHNGKSN
jgi:DNA polymerase-3 subunit alpha